VRVLLEYVATLCRADADARGIAFEITSPAGLACRADPFQIQQILLNLVSNAVHHGDAGSTVRLGAVADPGADVVHIHVANTGPCIPMEIVNRVFEPFVSGRPGGTGLGLAISQRLAGGMGGQILLAENLDGRVVFELQIPGVKGEELP
jgi:two-component system sensor kinase FixL